MGRTRGEPKEIKKNTHPTNITALFGVQAHKIEAQDNRKAVMVGQTFYSTPITMLFKDGDVILSLDGTRREPFNPTPMGVNSISPARPPACAYAPRGCIVRANGLATTRTIPTR